VSSPVEKLLCGSCDKAAKPEHHRTLSDMLKQTPDTGIQNNSIFFIATGFHGIHVIIGTLFLLINILHNTKAHFSNNHHLRFETTA